MVASWLHKIITLLKSLSLKYMGRNAKNLDGEMWRKNNKKVALEMSKPTQGKEKEEKRKEANLGRGGKKIINSQGIWNGARGCGGVKGQNIPSAARVGLEQQSCITRKHLRPLRGERICVPVLDWHSICPVKGAHPPNTLRLSLLHLWSKLRGWSYLLVPAFRSFTQNTHQSEGRVICGASDNEHGCI